MVWSLVRVTVFTAAFLIGTMLSGSDGSSAASKSSAIPQLDEKAGTSLVIACNGGSVTVKRLNDRGAVQFDCARSNMVVVRDHPPTSEKIPEFRPLRNELQLLLIR